MDQHSQRSTESDEATQETAPVLLDPPRRRGVGGWMLWLLRATTQSAGLLVFLVVALTIGWVQSDDFQRRVKGVTEGLLEKQLGEEGTLGRVNVRFWPPGVDVVGLHVFHGSVEEGTILSAERIRAPLVLRGGRPALGQLQIRGPLLSLHVDDDGLREFRNAPRPDKPTPLKRLPWSSLRIDEGTIRVAHPEGSIEITSLSLLPDRDGTARLVGDLTLTVRDLTDTTKIDWPNVIVGPDTIEIPQLRLLTDILTVDGSARWELDGPLEADLTTKIRLAALNPLLPAPRKVTGTLDADVQVRGRPDDPSVEVTAAVSGLRLDVPGVHTPVLHYNIGALSASARADRTGLHVEQLLLPWGDGTLIAWGEIDPYGRLTNGHVVGQDVRLAPLLQKFDAAPTPWVDMRADAEIVVEGTLNPLLLEGDFDLGVAQLQVGDRPAADPRVEWMLDIPHAHASGDLLLEKHHIRLTSDLVQGPRTQGSIAVDIGFGPRGPLDLQLDIWGADLEDFQPLKGVALTGRGVVRGRIYGPFNALQFEGIGDIEDFSVLGIPYADRLAASLRSPDMKSLYLDDAAAMLGATRYRGSYGIDFQPPMSMTTDIVIDDGRIEDMVGMFVDLDGIRGDMSGTLTLDGPLFDMDGAGHLQLANVELYGEHFDTGEGHGYLDKGRFTLDDLRVRRAQGTAGLTLRGSVERAWALDMELMADGLRLSDLDHLKERDLPLSGRLAAAVRVTNTLFDPSPDGRIWVTDVRYAGEPVANSIVDFDTTDGVAVLRGRLIGGTAEVKGTLGLWQEQPYDLTATLHDVPAHLLYPEAVDGTPLRAVASGTVDINGHLGPQWSPVSLNARLPHVEVSYAEHMLRNETPWTYVQTGSSFELTNFSLAGGGTRFQLNASGGDALVLSGEGTVDLGLLRAVVPGLRRASGKAEIELYALGARPNVEAVIDVEVDAELLRHDSAPVALEDTRASLRIRQDGIELRSLTGGLGGGTFTGSGTIAARDWVPTRFDMTLDVDDAEVQWVPSLPPAIGHAALSFDGPSGALLLSGDVKVTDMTFSERIDWEDWVVESRAQMLVDPATTYDDDPLFNMNIAIHADETIRLRNNVAEGLASADLRIIGDTVRPGLVGTVQLHDDSLAFLQDREFRVDRGSLVFNDPWSWDPQLDFSLLTDIDSREQRYRVDYQVHGPFSDWRTATRSDPPLAQSDVNALLWFGVTLDELEQRGELSTALVSGVADLLVTDFFISGQAGDLGQDLPDFLFDRIDLATGVTARGDYSPEPRLVIEKRLDDDLGVDLGVDLTWELNLVRPDDTYVSANKRIGGIWSLSAWYATLQRDRVLPIGGAYGADVTARWELE